MYTALEEAGQIIDDLFSSGVKSYRIRVDMENQFIIAELQAACHYYPGMLEWSVLGSVNTGVAYFTLHNKTLPIDPNGGTVIEASFRRRRRAKRAA